MHLQYKFARKILKKETTREIDWKIEQENLRIFTQQRHENIVQALWFYEWREHVNFVFPFIEGTLESLMKGNWEGPVKDYAENRKSPNNWLWIQMVRVAEALKVIHNPQSSIFKRNDKRAVGFHFDLKPANILVTEKGILKISDFGLSLIKKVSPGSTSYGFFRGGAPRYQAPEVSPVHLLGTQTSISTYALAKEDVSDEVRNKYDIWSYACIVLEIMIYLFEEEGKKKLKEWEEQMNAESPGCAFHYNGKLKKSVENAIQQAGGHATACSDKSAYDAWASDVTSYIRMMFDFRPASRPSSTEVFDKLSSLQTEYEERPGDEIGQELMMNARQEYPKDKFDQVYWCTDSGNRSFIKMSVQSH